ncbi:chemotaxis protein CheB [Actinomycetospora flava]|uniref:histidine kinase n=1 Tax=Actinomycetospora flava TaxID=3129232 RepID=A0ABU8M900_9PSEU
MGGSAADRPLAGVVVLVASAGGFDAIIRVLLGLPADAGVPVVVAQHLSGPHEKFVGVLSRRVGRVCAWAEDGDVVADDRVTACPPGSVLEVLPDGTCSVRPLDGAAGHHRFDVLLSSVAESFGAGAVAAVLSGMGSDGTAGARAVRAAGGVVLVQDEDTAEHFSMPGSVVDAGVADRVLPVDEIGAVIGNLAGGFGLPPSRAELDAVRTVLAGAGEVARLARGTDWEATPFGAVSGWPPALRTTVRLVLGSPLAMCLWWGPDRARLPNDAYRALMGADDTGLGQPGDVPDVLDEDVERRVRAGESVEVREVRQPVTRGGGTEDASFDLAVVPVEDAGTVPGILATVVERTAEVLADRRLRALHELTERTADADGWHETFERAIGVLAGHAEDVPFALGYRIDHVGAVARLVAGTGAAGVLAPPRMPLGERWGWPLAHAESTGEPVLVEDVGARFADAGRDGDPPCRRALVLPLPHTDGEAGALVLGLPPRHDARHEEFLRLVGAAVALRLGEARTREKDRERAERLAALERARTSFFADVSHEFRTPLTLVLAPVEDGLARPDLPDDLRADLELARRHARRLLRLVGTLLDSAHVRAGRLRARFEPADLAALTAEIVAVFREAADRGGVALRVDAAPLPAPVWLDPQLWERILAHLLSNALKHTFEGAIDVRVRALPHHAEVQVADTGVGIPRTDLPLVFQRFHRVATTAARSHDGAGIGLSLTEELVRRHRGRIRVRSEEKVGTTVTVWLPMGSRPEMEHTVEERSDHPLDVAEALAEEAAAWAPVDGDRTLHDVTLLDEPPGAAGDPVRSSRVPGARVLVAEDHPDLRRYLHRLLAATWDVRTVEGAAEVLEAAREHRPDVVLADVTAPPDGPALVRRLRADPQLRATPIVLLTTDPSADAGADDHLVTPFSGRELVARLGAQIELARLRHRGAEGAGGAR